MCLVSVTYAQGMVRAATYVKPQWVDYVHGVKKPVLPLGSGNLPDPIVSSINLGEGVQYQTIEFGRRLGHQTVVGARNHANNACCRSASR
jgi:hypothetical protein